MRLYEAFPSLDELYGMMWVFIGITVISLSCYNVYMSSSSSGTLSVGGHCSPHRGAPSVSVIGQICHVAQVIGVNTKGGQLQLMVLTWPMTPWHIYVYMCVMLMYVYMTWTLPNINKNQVQILFNFNFSLFMLIHSTLTLHWPHTFSRLFSHPFHVQYRCLSGHLELLFVAFHC